MGLGWELKSKVHDWCRWVVVVAVWGKLGSYVLGALEPKVVGAVLSEA